MIHFLLSAVAPSFQRLSDAFVSDKLLTMLQPILPLLNSKRIILASGSPRRKEILAKIGLKFDIVKSNFEENLDKAQFSSPLDYVRETSRQKTLDVVHRLYAKDEPPDLIIGADTIITMDGVIYEKPLSKQHACEILSRLSGGSHQIHTAVNLVTPCITVNTGDVIKSDADRYKTLMFLETTEVNMAELTPEIIESYVETGEPMDKAGGYGIQAAGCTLISGIKGDYFNVMGFPVHKFAKEILKLFAAK